MSERSPIEEQVIALAGIAQAARLVDQIARTGSFPQAFFEASLRSLFSFDAPDVESVYGNIQGVKLGLQNIMDITTKAQDEVSLATAGYVRGILKLEKLFRSRDDLQQVIHSRLGHVNYKATHFTDNITEISASVGSIYQDTLSQLPYRIKVKGNAQHLQSSSNADLVRTLLLAGVRAAHLWHQIGGRPRHFVFKNSQIRNTAAELARELSPVDTLH